MEGFWMLGEQMKYCCVFLKQMVDIIYTLLYGRSPSICFILINGFIISHPKQRSGIYPDPCTHPHTHPQVTENAGNCTSRIPFDSVNPKMKSYKKQMSTYLLSENCNSGSIDSDRNPDGVPLLGWSQGVITRDGGNYMSGGGSKKVFYRC